MLGSEERAVKVHHLVKAPENSPESIKFRESWDAKKPATVYNTPERLTDGTKTHLAHYEWIFDYISSADHRPGQRQYNDRSQR